MALGTRMPEYPVAHIRDLVKIAYVTYRYLVFLGKIFSETTEAFPRIVNNSWKGICLFLFALYSQVSQKRILIQKEIETRKEVSKSSSMLHFRNFISRKSTVCMNARGGRKKSLFNSEIRSDVGTIRCKE